MAQTAESINETINDSILRSFYYYDIMPLRKNGDGKYEEEKDQQGILYSAFERVNTMFNNKEQEKLIISLDNGERVYIIPDEVSNGNPIKFRLVLVRIDGLPLVEQEGKLISLTDFIENDFGLAEIVHCVIFPKYGILGAEYNISGARVTCLKEYLPKIVQDIEYLYCVPHLRQDVFQQLVDNEGLSLFQLEIKNTPETKKYIYDSRSVFLAPFTKIPDNDTYEVTIKRRKGKAKKGFQNPMSSNEMKALIENCGDDIKTFKISQGAVRRDAIDLLGQKVVHKTDVTRTANKHVDSSDAYRIIVEYFNDKLKGTLQPRS